MHKSLVLSDVGAAALGLEPKLAQRQMSFYKKIRAKKVARHFYFDLKFSLKNKLF
jgi:hypothetical protein